MGAHISKVKHLKLDRWEDSQVNRIREVGNIAARLHYEERVPPCYRRPNPDAPQVLIEQWIRAKYEREEFCHPERQNHYVSGFMEGFLMKRGKEDSRYHPRKFVLCEAEDTLKYHVKENKEPKAVLRISELNVAFAPPKTGNQNSLQISFMKDGTTRHIYVYHEDPEVITNWYLAIRCAKLHRLQVAYPGATEAELLSQLTRDFPREGFLWKTGPRYTDAYKKRWFTLDGRKLMYHDDPMDAHPKGEIFLGHSSDGFAIKTGVPPGARDQGFSFTLETPDRTYLLSAQSDDDRSQWMNVIQKVIDKPLTPQDATVAARLIRKRTASGTMNIFSSTRSRSFNLLDGIGPMGPLAPIAGPQSFMDLASQGFPPLPPPIPLPGMNDSPLEFSTNKNQPPVVREAPEDNSDKRNEKSDIRRERENRDNRDTRDNRRSRSDRSDRRERDRERREERSERDRREERRPDDRNSINSSNSNNSHNNNSNNNEIPSSSNTGNTPNLGTQMEQATGVWGMGVGYPVMGMGPMGPMGPMMSEMTLGPHMGHTHSYGPMSMGMMSHDGSMIGAQILGPEQIMNDAAQIMSSALPPPPTSQGTKEIIHCKSCTLFPPNPNAPPPTTRERPPGCRTIFVGGLPENITETIIQEIFERCGEITTLRLSKKNFCHIRFVLESSVDAAIYLSGYRVRIGSSGDPANTGRLHVDFAQARDDQYEWECRQRQLQREQRHRERVEKERQRAPSSPPPVVHYTDHEASNICEKIKQDDTFMKAVQTKTFKFQKTRSVTLQNKRIKSFQVVVTWLERGDCTKRNANTFYSMIQSTNSHVRRLLTEKVAYEEELQKAKELMKGRMQGLLIQFSQIERVFTAASHKKVWDHFTKAQRKNIEMWKKQSSEIKAVQLEESLMEGEGEMEVSDSEEEPQRKKARNQSDSHDDIERLQTLKEENDSLRCQLEAYKNEVDLLKSETKSEIDAKDKQMKMLQQTLKGMQEQLMQSRKQQAQDDEKIKDLTVKLNATKKEEPRESEIITLDKDDDVNEEPRTPKQLVLTSSFVQISQKDAKLIGLIATFLHIHPFGASVDYLWSYLQKMEPGIKPNEVEALMQRFPQVFKQDLFGIGANMERRWQFSGFNVYRNH